MASPPNKSQVPVGTVLEGKFRITKEIGRGGMATVYEAENITLGKRVAVKILSAELVTSRIVRERFIREARAAAAIRSPNICDVYDSGMFDSRPFLVMELLEGESLYDMMTRVRRIDADTTLAVMTQAARGLQKAHDSSVIHRDLKPENIFIIKTPEGEMVVKILDFGLAKFYEQTGEAASPRLTREGALFGTPAYMSPEQAKGQGEVDLRADLWALGCIVYECLTGTTVWNVDQGVAMILAQIAGAPIPKPSKLLPDLPARFDSWFTKALERDPEKRFQTAKEFAETLAEALQPATSVSPPAWRQSSAPSAEEGALVDLLVNQSQSGIPPARPAPSPADAVLTNTPSPAKKSGMGAIWALLAVASLALGGYAAWFYGLFPRPPVARPATSLPTASASVAPAPSASVPTYDRPLETDAYAKSVAQAQELMQNGQGDASLAAFKEAFNNGGSGVSRGLLSQAAVAIPNSDGKCKAMALGRPRPFDRTTPSSRPDIAVTTVGPIVTWVDNQQDATRRQAFTTVLDTALRRVAPARLVTPEASSARHTQLLVAGNRLALLFWDDGGADPGVHARLLEPDGRMAGPSRRISEAKRAEFYPSFDRGADGSYWVVWEQAVDDGVDLVARHLSHEVEPLGPITRLTALGSGRDGHGALASRPSLAIAESGLVISFMLERDKKRRVMILDVPFTDSALATGVKIDGKKKTEDRHLGKLIAVSPTRGTRGEARIVCDKAECFVAWDDDKAGAFAGFFNLEKSQTIWHREFARGGSAPSIAKSPTGAMVAYFEGNRVKLASMTRDGVEPAGVIAKVGGTQPYPAIAAGSKAGQWYVSWRDYESGHLEPYVVRAECQ